MFAIFCATIEVFPMHVGVFPYRREGSYIRAGLPHARGGVSEIVNRFHKAEESSPCTWGCFYAFLQIFAIPTVFPMHVGVFLSPFDTIEKLYCLPHARGGVSWPDDLRLGVTLSSPCTWGCFQIL